MEKSESLAANKEFSIVIAHNVLISIITLQSPKVLGFSLGSRGVEGTGALEYVLVPDWRVLTSQSLEDPPRHHKALARKTRALWHYGKQAGS